MSKEASKKKRGFAWKAVSPSAFECEHNGAKLHIEKAGAGWTWWVRGGKGLIQDGCRYDSYQDACDAAEEAAKELRPCPT